MQSYVHSICIVPMTVQDYGTLLRSTPNLNSFSPSYLIRLFAVITSGFIVEPIVWMQSSHIYIFCLMRCCLNCD